MKASNINPSIAFAAAMVSLASAVIQPSATAAEAEFFELGSLGWPRYTGASNVSPDGSGVVGDACVGTDNFYGQIYDAFVWRRPGPIARLEAASSGLTGVLASASSAASDGSAVIVGIQYSKSTYDSSAFYWQASSGAVSLGDLPGGRNKSAAQGVSEDGSVIVGNATSSNGDEAFIYTRANGMIGLGDLIGGDFASMAYDISGDGAVVVGYGTSAGGNEAFRWTASGGMIGLGDFTGGGFYSAATGASFDGSVIVGESLSASGYEAFRWTASGGMVGLGDLPGGLFRSCAFAVSGDGSVIVGSGNTSGTVQDERAMIWDQHHGMRKLQDVLTNVHGVDLTGWTLNMATGISRDGRVIVGYGVGPQSAKQSWMAVLPDSSVPTYQQWLVLHGLPSDASGLGAPEASPSGDGIPNLVKAALWIDPWIAGYQGGFQFGVSYESGTRQLVVTLRRPEPSPRGFAYILETTSNLHSWNVGDLHLLNHQRINETRVLHYVDQNLASGSCRFARLRIQKQE
jgi:probable HAF family extracellular repeat protein